MSIIADDAIPIRRSLRPSFARIGQAFKEDGLAIGLIACQVILVLIVTDLDASVLATEIPGNLLIVTAMMLITAVALLGWQYLRIVKPVSPIRQLCHDGMAMIRGGWFERWLPLAIAFSCLFTTFPVLKSSIPALAGGFQWDRTFFELDLWLHGGVSPWEWLQPVLGYAPITFLLNLNYSLWFSLMWGMFFFHQIMETDRPARLRFIMSFVLLWTVGGGLLAVLLSSAGPCFYGLVVPGENAYAPLMAYLQQVDAHWPLSALTFQKLLWLDHEAGGQSFGVSAMPSLHNAIAMLMVLGSRRFDRRIHLVFVAHAAMIYLGSIHLAWHYAVDAYVSWALAVTVWLATKPIAVWWDRKIERSQDGQLAFPLMRASNAR